MNNENSIVDKRHLSRLLAVQFLFTKFFAEKNNLDYQPFEPQTLLQLIDETKFNNNLYEKIIEGVEKHEKEIDTVVKRVAPEWPLDQINPINLIILRMAIWEAFIVELTPPKVAINEAIELDKELSSKTNSSFINGVLGTIYNDKETQDKLAKLNKDDNND